MEPLAAEHLGPALVDAALEISRAHIVLLGHAQRLPERHRGSAMEALEALERVMGLLGELSVRVDARQEVRVPSGRRGD
jgi:hypothetical protein